MYNTPFVDVVPPLSSEEYMRLKEDIHHFGITVPILIDEYNNIIDGHHRLRIAEELSIEEFPVEIKPGLTEGEKRLMAWTLNANRRQLSKDDMPLGQRLALERVVDAIEEAGYKATCIVAEHDTKPDEDIDAARCLVAVYRYHGQWITPSHAITVRDAIDRLLV